MNKKEIDWGNYKGYKGKYSKSMRVILNYCYMNDIPLTIVYNDGSREEDLELISYDQFNVLLRGEEEDFVVLKHSIKKIITAVDMKAIIDETRDLEKDMQY